MARLDKEFSEQQEKIIQYLKERQRINTALYAEFLKISNDTALRELNELKSIGVIIKKGIGRAAYYVLK